MTMKIQEVESSLTHEELDFFIKVCGREGETRHDTHVHVCLVLFVSQSSV